ncbi:MAG: HEAT repeat domain-containing protein [Spirochaetaceae bacterium]|jgi:HEAT repeat protein|nr:HEAT repeat domain-containing protein [Spirochaetaceae bacterium]
MILTMKRFAAALIALGTLTVTVPAQQQNSNQREMSVEESYLQQSVELMVIREQSHADSREMKLLALQYIGEAIERGNTSREIRDALEYMGLEGVLNQARENNRLVNDFPDIRREAAKYLGEMGTPEAKDALLRMLKADREPMVLQEAVRSLGRIGINDNNETVATIAHIVTRFDSTDRADNLLALSAIDAFESLAERNNGIRGSDAINVLIRIAEGRYIRPVQDRARQALSDLRKYTAQQNQSGSGSGS